MRDVTNQAVPNVPAWGDSSSTVAANSSHFCALAGARTLLLPAALNPRHAALSDSGHRGGISDQVENNDPPASSQAHFLKDHRRAQRWSTYMLRIAVVVGVFSVPFGMRFMTGTAPESGPYIADAMAFSATILVIVGLWISTFVEERFNRAVDSLRLDACTQSFDEKPLSTVTYFLSQGSAGLYFALLVGAYFVWWYYDRCDDCKQLWHVWENHEARYYVCFSSLLSFAVGSRLGAITLYGCTVASLAHRQKTLDLIVSHPDGFGGLGPVAALLRMPTILVGALLVWISIWLSLLMANWPKGIVQYFPGWKLLLVLLLGSLMLILWFGTIYPLKQFAPMIGAAKQRLVQQVTALSSAALIKAQLDSVETLSDFLAADQAAAQRSTQLRAIQDIPEVPITWTRTELIEVAFGVPFFFGALVVMFQMILGRTSLLEIIGSFS